MRKERFGILSLALVLVLSAAGAVSAQSASQCHPLLASLMPKDAVRVTGTYFGLEPVGMGSAAADLPFDNPCTKAVTPNPGKLTFEVKHYKDGKLFQSQIGAVEDQTLQNARREFEKKLADLKKAKPGPVAVSPLRTEKVPGGTLLFFDYEVDCSEGVKRSHPVVRLIGVAHTGNSAITVHVEGFVSAAAAKAAASTVMANFMKADFSKATKAR